MKCTACTREAKLGAKRCAACLDNAGVRREAKRVSDRADRAAFFARHAPATAAVVVQPTGTLATVLRTGDLTGRVLGFCTVVRRIAGSRWECRCGACGEPFTEISDRIMSGKAASVGCGCARRAPPRPGGPMPRAGRGE